MNHFYFTAGTTTLGVILRIAASFFALAGCIAVVAIVRSMTAKKKKKGKSKREAKQKGNNPGSRNRSKNARQKHSRNVSSVNHSNRGAADLPKSCVSLLPRINSAIYPGNRVYYTSSSVSRTPSTLRPQSRRYLDPTYSSPNEQAMYYNEITPNQLF